MDKKKLNEIGMTEADDADEGMRLDKYLLKMLPDSGLRERRRLIENGLVTVNGRSCRSGLKMFSGAKVVLFEAQARMCSAEVASCLSIISETAEFAALFKPENMHSAAIAGSPEPSIEDCLSEVFPDRGAILANRLDKLTSGILLIAFGVEQENRFRELEDQGKAGKFYLAKVYGQPEGDFIVKNKLDTADRLRTKVLDEQGDSVRWSRAEVVDSFDDGTTLLRVQIAKGARHQIRAHLAHAGFPIVGDPVYGDEHEQVRLYLHHERISFPGFEAKCSASWD